MLLEKVPELMNALGMTSREAKIYVAMMEKPEWRAGELHRITGVPRARTHQTLEVMVTRQYCTKRSEGRYNYYHATPPDILKEILSDRWDEEIALRKNRTQSVLAPLESIFDMATKGDRSLDFIEVVKTPYQIQKRFIELNREAKFESLSFNRSPYSFLRGRVSRKKRDEQTNVSVAALKRGVATKMLFMYEANIWSHLESCIEDIRDYSLCEIRVIDDLPLKMFLFDRETTMVCIDNILGFGKGSLDQIIIKDESFANMGGLVFNHFWEKAIPYELWDSGKQ